VSKEHFINNEQIDEEIDNNEPINDGIREGEGSPDY
jgi:hypothetical protein